MGEKTDVIVEQLQSHTRIGVHRIERHIGRSIHRLRIMLKTSQLHGVCHCDVQFVFLTDGCGIKRRFHHPIMAEGRILLGMDHQGHEQEQCDKIETFHLIITHFTAILLYGGNNQKSDAGVTTSLLALIFILVEV